MIAISSKKCLPPADFLPSFVFFVWSPDLVPVGPPLDSLGGRGWPRGSITIGIIIITTAIITITVIT